MNTLGVGVGLEKIRLDGFLEEMNSGRVLRMASSCALVAFLGLEIGPLYFLTYGAPHLLACCLLFWVCDRADRQSAALRKKTMLTAAAIRLAMVVHTCWVALDLRFGHGIKVESTLLLTGSLVLAAMQAQPTRVNYFIGLAPPLLSMLAIVALRPMSEMRTGLATLLMLSTVLMAAIRQQRLGRRALALQARSDAAARELRDSLTVADLADEVGRLGHWRLGPGENHVWSPGVFHIFGMPVGDHPPSVEEAIGFYREADRAHVAEAVARAQAMRSGFSFEHQIVRRDGSQRTLTVKARFLEDEAGGSLVGVVQDVTEQRAEERRRKDADARYKLLADNASDMIVQATLSGRITYISAACLAVTGYSAHELIGRKISDFMVEEDAVQAAELLNQALASKSPAPWRLEYRVRRKDGTVIWLECHPRLSFNDEGAPIGIVDVVRDADARKAMERDLVAAREAAEAGAQAKTDFLANMSHELRTPLNSIVGFSSLIAGSPELTRETRRRAGMVHDASRALVAIVNDVLEASRIEAEGVTLHPEAAQIGPLIQSVIELVRQDAEAKGLDLLVQLPAKPIRVLVDAARLRQVLLNLVGNAVKFTEHGSVCISVVRDAQDRLRFAVKDSGVGIPLDRQAAVFQRFAQADGSTARRFGGSGLGLTISHSIIEAMGGEIGVHSVEKAGSTFWFVIAPPEAGKLPGPSAAPAPDALDLKGVRLLLADDNPMNRDLFAALLEQTGVDITFAENGAEALAAVQKQAFDIVFMDVQMPVMDGFEATRAIRASGVTRLPIIALTANVLQPQIDQCLASGMNAHLGKPFRLKDVLTTLAQWAERPASSPGGVQTDVIELLERAIGPEKLAHFLAGLSEQLHEVIELMGHPKPDVEELARQTHQVCGYAASLGYVEIGQRYRELEHACRSGDDFHPTLHAARSATRAALADIEDRRAA